MRLILAAAAILLTSSAASAGAKQPICFCYDTCAGYCIPAQ